MRAADRRPGRRGKAPRRSPACSFRQRQPAAIDRQAWCCRATTGNVGRSPATCWKAQNWLTRLGHRGSGNGASRHGALGQSRQRRDARCLVVEPLRRRRAAPRQAAAGILVQILAGARPGERLRSPAPGRDPPPASAAGEDHVEHDHRGAGRRPAARSAGRRPIAASSLICSGRSRRSAEVAIEARPRRPRRAARRGPRTRNSRRARRVPRARAPRRQRKQTCPARPTPSPIALALTILCIAAPLRHRRAGHRWPAG